MATFDDAVTVILAHEGGYVNNPDDAGGETKFGISKRNFPAIDIAGLGEAGAKAIYRMNYWNVLYNGISSQDVATKLLDLSVNMGTVTAVKLFQESLDIPADGIFGQQTLDAANKAKPQALLAEFRARAAQHYTALAIAYPKDRAFLLGWLRRAVA